MALNTLADKLELEFVKLNHNNAAVKITAPCKADISSINAILNAGFSYFNDKKRYSWEYEEGWSDGVEYIYNKHTQVLPIGLIPRAVRYLRDSKPKLKIKVSDDIRKIYSNPFGEVSRDKISAYSNSLNLYNRIENIPITPYDHQLRLIETALNRRRASLLACTSAGKSLSLYIGVRYLTEVEKKRNVLVVVPSSALVKQLFTDFRDDYGWEKAKDHCTLIYGESDDKLNAKQKKALEELKLGEEAMLKEIQSLRGKVFRINPNHFSKYSMLCSLMKHMVHVVLFSVRSLNFV